jgi:hypothetical protein
MDPQEVIYAAMEWIELAHDRGMWWVFMNTGMNILVP